MTSVNNLNLVIDRKTMAALASLLKVKIETRIPQVTLVLKVEPSAEEQYEDLLGVIKKLGLQKAKAEFRMHPVEDCRSCEGLAEVVWADRKRQAKTAAGNIKNFPKSSIEWHTDGKIFVNGEEAVLTSTGPNPGLMIKKS